MKPLLITLALCSCTAYAAITPPDWSEFYSPRKSLSAGIFSRGKKKRVDAAYWVTRKAQFDNQVKNCQQLLDDTSVSNCFNQIRQIEATKNVAYQNEVQGEAVSTSNRYYRYYR